MALNSLKREGNAWLGTQFFKPRAVQTEAQKYLCELWKSNRQPWKLQMGTRLWPAEATKLKLNTGPLTQEEWVKPQLSYALVLVNTACPPKSISLFWGRSQLRRGSRSWASGGRAPPCGTDTGTGLWATVLTEGKWEEVCLGCRGGNALTVSRDPGKRQTHSTRGQHQQPVQPHRKVSRQGLWGVQRYKAAFLEVPDPWTPHSFHFGKQNKVRFSILCNKNRFKAG